MYSGPYLIIETMGPVNAKIQLSRRSQPFIVHIDKLKPCLGRTPVSWLNEDHTIQEEEREAGIDLGGLPLFDDDQRETAEEEAAKDDRNTDAEDSGFEQSPCQEKIERPRREVRRPAHLRDFV